MELFARVLRGLRKWSEKSLLLGGLAGGAFALLWACGEWLIFGRWLIPTLRESWPWLARQGDDLGLHVFTAIANGILDRNLVVALPLLGFALVVAGHLAYHLVVAVVGTFLEVHQEIRFGRLVHRLIVWLPIGDTLKQRFAPKHKQIVICLDGTWNYPTQEDRGQESPTNVFRFWQLLEGRPEPWRELRLSADQIKWLRGEHRQVGLYYSGVGNRFEHTMLGELLGGAFGFGARRIKRRAYRDLIRYYNPGDAITIVGFSRGAAIARWLAGDIDRRGVPAFSFMDRFPIRQLLGWLFRKTIFVDRPVVGFLGVWDTVASFGLAKNVFGIPFQRINLFKDFTVSETVRVVRHLVSIDERRDAFLPTLMDPDPDPDLNPDVDPDRLKEIWFAGIHSNVGGGYADDGLAKITLNYMCQEALAAHPADGPALRLDAVGLAELVPELLDVASEVRNQDSALYSTVLREIPWHDRIHRSALDRIKWVTLRYAPRNIDDLLDQCRDQKHASLRVLDELQAQNKIGLADHEEEERNIIESPLLRIDDDHWIY